MTVEFRRSSEFDLSALAALFTASYEGYFVTFAVTETQLEYMVDVYDFDLSSSLVAVDGDRPIGLANLARRGQRSWLAGVGVVPERRGSGAGEALTRMLLDKARAAGAQEMMLEVIVENAAAIRLYEKLGFARTRELEVLALDSATERSDARDVDLEEGLALVAAARIDPEPWQRADDTIANLARRGSAPRAIAVDGAAAVFSEDGHRVSVLQAAGDAAGLRALVAALRSRGTVSALNFPADGAVAATLREAGATVQVRQYEMVVSLT